LTIKFYNGSTGGNLTYSWDFGDGGHSANKNPSHPYAGPGDYNVTLTVTNSFGTDEYSDTVHVEAPAPTDPPTEPPTEAPTPPTPNPG
jgi:PKD repeat protein